MALTLCPFLVKRIRDKQIRTNTTHDGILMAQGNRNIVLFSFLPEFFLFGEIGRGFTCCFIGRLDFTQDPSSVPSVLVNYLF